MTLITLLARETPKSSYTVLLIISFTTCRATEFHTCIITAHSMIFHNTELKMSQVGSHPLCAGATHWSPI